MEDNKKIYDLIILGGGCAGLTAGIYAGRAKLKTVIIEKQQVGGQASITNEIENYPGFKNIAGPELMERMLEQAKSFGTEFLLSDVTKVDLQNEIKEIETSSGIFKSRSVILATGANPRKLGFEGEDEFRGKGVGYCATCDGFFFQNKDIFVIGGGYSAAEEALYLTRFGKKVTVIVRKDKFKAAQTIIDKVISNPKIEVKYNTELIKAYGDQLLKGAIFKNNQTGETTNYEVLSEDDTFGIFVFIGYKPDSEIFKDQVELDREGYVITNDKMETNLKGVFAAGDIRPKQLRQLVTATSDGAIAAMNAEKYVEEVKEKYGIKDADNSEMQENKNISKENKDLQTKFLNSEIQKQVVAVFEKLKKDIVLVSIVDKENDKSKELKKFLEEICDLGNHLKLEIYQKGENSDIEQKINFNRLPVVALLDNNKNYSGVKFCGIPSGHEFNSFIIAIYNLAGEGQEIDESLKNRIKRIDNKVNLQIVISLSCHFCPEVVISAQRFAIMNSNIEAEMIDISLFPEMKKKYNIMSVPALIVNDDKIAFGTQTMENILDLIEN